MFANNTFDVIILGAGISGLLLGSELSKKHRTLIVEKENRIPERKYWLTSSKCLAENPDFADLVDSRYDYMDFISHDKTAYRCNGDYVLWDTAKLLQRLLTSIESNGGHILRGHQFYSFRYAKDGIYVDVNNLEFKSRLLVDCMGFSSPIIYAKNTVRIKGYYFLYGSIIRTVQPIPPICLANVMINAKPKYLEVFPTSTGEAYAAILAPTNRFRTPDNLQKDFEFLVKHSHYSKFFSQEAKQRRPLFGTVPVGRIVKQSLDRIAFYGEAGMVHPAATASGLTRMLLNYKTKARFLSTRLEEGRLNSNDLADSPSWSEDFNRAFQLSLFNQVLHWNSDQFCELVQKMRKMDNQTINSILFGEINVSETFRRGHLWGQLKRGNHFMLRPFLRALFS